MAVSGRYGELVVTGGLAPRWIRWVFSTTVLVYVVFELVVGLSAATDAKENEGVNSWLELARIVTVISWCRCPVVCRQRHRRRNERVTVPPLSLVMLLVAKSPSDKLNTRAWTPSSGCYASWWSPVT